MDHIMIQAHTLFPQRLHVAVCMCVYVWVFTAVGGYDSSSQWASVAPVT